MRLGVVLMIRKKVSVIVVTMAFFIFLMSMATAYSEYSWSMFRYNPERTGYTSCPGPTTNQTLWVYDTLHDLFGPCPAVVDNLLYIGGGYGTNVTALNATTGALVWYYNRSTWFVSSPAVANGLVYFGGFDRNVTALNATTGALRWNYTLPTGGYIAASSPTVVDDVVYIGGGYGDTVLALNATTGDYLWNFTGKGNFHSSPAVVNGVVYIGSFDKNVYALNASTGQKIWNYTTGNNIFSSPAVAEGIVYIGSYDYNFYALNATTGVKIWNYTTGDWVASSPAVANGIVYVGVYDNRTYAFNATTGEKIWEFATNGPISSSPAVSCNGIVYIGSGDNNTYALDAITGAKIWSYATKGDVFSSPALADGVLYAPSRDGKIYAFIGTQSTFNAVWESTNYPVSIASNSSVSCFEFSQPDGQISFNVTGPRDMSSYCNVTIPKNLMTGPWTVQIDGTDVPSTVSEMGTITSIYIEYSHTSTHNITITASWVVTEFPIIVTAPLLLVSTLLAALIARTCGSQRQKSAEKYA
jgi:outer membrane protein assembly factor BamB